MRAAHIIIRLLCIWAVLDVSRGLATKSPNPQEILPTSLEFSVPNTLGYSRGSYTNLKFGTLVYDSGPNALEETALGETRYWVFQAAGGSISIDRASYPATCIRAKRMNELTPSLEFYYEFRISALEGSCSSRPENRRVEIAFEMDDFVVKKFRTGALRFFGETKDLLLFPVLLKAPERVKAKSVENGLFVTGAIDGVAPFVAQLHLELMLRPKCQLSCRKTVVHFDSSTCTPSDEITVDWNRDPYSSVSVDLRPNGSWGATIPRTGGAVCLRLVGGTWMSAVTAAELP